MSKWVYPRSIDSLKVFNSSWLEKAAQEAEDESTRRGYEGKGKKQDGPFAEISIEDGLALGDGAVLALELAVDPEVVDLRERQLVRIQVPRRQPVPAVLQNLVQTLLQRRQLVRYRHQLLRYRLRRRHQSVY